MSSGYDFGQLYGMADMSSVSPLEDGSQHDGVVEDATFGRTKDGTKGQWTIKFRTTTGERAGYPLTTTLSINPVKNDGSPNPQGLGIMFRQLGAMGIPVPPDAQPFWALGWDENQVAMAMKGRPVLLKIKNETYDDVVRSKVSDIRPPRPGAPLQVQQPQQAGYGGQGGAYGANDGQYGYQGGGGAASGYGQQGVTYGANGAPQPGGGGGGQYFQPQNQGYGQPQGQPGGYAGPQGAPAQQPPQGQGPVAPGPWQGSAQPPAGGPQQGQIPGAPGWAQPPSPGQGGQGEFTAQGQSYQGYPGQQQPNQQPNPQQGQQPPQGWAPQNGQQGQVPPGGGAPPQQGGAWQGTPPPASGQGPVSPSNPQQGAPDLPPWAQ